MAAVSVESSNKVWQKAKAALANANPAAVDAFQALKVFLATQKRNPDLQFVSFSEADADAAGGTVLISSAAKIYGVYIKKENSATDNFAFIYDDATDDTTANNARISFPLLVANDEQLYINPAGLDIATGITVTQYTTALGTTDGSNGGSGFLIVGAA